MPLSAYIHVPFCLSRCDYCSFYSGESLALLPDYPDWVHEEARLRSRSEPTFLGPVTTIYFGGGTPSLLGPSGVARALDALDQSWGIATDAEISLEINPSAAIDLPGFRGAGVTRLSIGVQSLDDGILQALARAHTGEDALHAAQAAALAGFDSVSADLLFGLPGLLPNDLRQAARALASSGVQHLSIYSLEVHPNTPLGRRRRKGLFSPAAPDEEEAQWNALDEELRSLGLDPYEVSNYSLPGYRCRHNLAYWTGIPYVGLGPGSHSYQPAAGAWGSRLWNAPDLQAYAISVTSGRSPPGDREVLSLQESLLEALFLTLRRTDPVRLPGLCARYGLDSSGLPGLLAQLTGAGLLEGGPCPGTFTPTRLGLRTADGVARWLFQHLGLPPDAASAELPRTLELPRPAARHREDAAASPLARQTSCNAPPALAREA